MTQLEELQNFYQKGIDPVWSPTPNHQFINMTQTGGERVPLIPGHFYTFMELNPVGPDEVPTYDEYQQMAYPSNRDKALIAKYQRVKKPYYDNRPIFLALSQDGFGLNIKIMSQLLRKKFIRTYLSRIQTPLEKCFVGGNLIDFKTRLGMQEVYPIFTVNLDFIRSISGLPDFAFNLLVNKYSRETMRNLTLIDWPEVPKLHLPNYSTDRTVSIRSDFSIIQIK